MDKPTQEQIKKFWEWCGITCKNNGDSFTAIQNGTQIIYLTGMINPEGFWRKRSIFDALPIDLNNLFKYAVPKAIYFMMASGRFSLKETALTILLDDMRDAVIAGKDPALALFWAIYKVMENVK